MNSQEKLAIAMVEVAQAVSKKYDIPKEDLYTVIGETFKQSMQSSTTETWNKQYSQYVFRDKNVL